MYKTMYTDYVYRRIFKLWIWKIRRNVVTLQGDRYATDRLESIWTCQVSALLSEVWNSWNSNIQTLANWISAFGKDTRVVQRAKSWGVLICGDLNVSKWRRAALFQIEFQREGERSCPKWISPSKVTSIKWLVSVAYRMSHMCGCPTKWLGEYSLNNKPNISLQIKWIG